MRVEGALNTVHPVPHAMREGTASWEVLLGFLLQASPQARTGVSRRPSVPHPTLDALLRLLGWEAGPCDPRPVTEPFRPSAQRKCPCARVRLGFKGTRKKQGRLPPSWIVLLPLGPGRGAASVLQSLKKKDPPSPHHA